MKRIDRLIRSLYKEIFLTIIMVLISIPIWLSFDIDELIESNKYDNYNYVNYEFLNTPSYTLASVSDEYALKNIETQDLVVYNYTKADAPYSLVLKIDKSSTVVIDSIKLNVNSNINYLKDFASYEDNNYYYYVLDTDHLQGTSQKYALSMWNEKDSIQDNNSYFNYEFVVI